MYQRKLGKGSLQARKNIKLYILTASKKGIGKAARTEWFEVQPQTVDSPALVSVEPLETNQLDT